MVGYCTPESLGGRLINGAKEVRIFGNVHEVKAKIEVMNQYSAHADYNEMLLYLSCQDKSGIKKLFLVHGEYETQTAWSQTLINNGYNTVEIPEKGSEWELN
jgi:metallo-beta-lactamase family protein